MGKRTILTREITRLPRLWAEVEEKGCGVVVVVVVVVVVEKDPTHKRLVSILGSKCMATSALL